MALHKLTRTGTTEELLKAEKAAYQAFDSRVEEMKYSGLGVVPHDGNNQKMIVSSLLSLLARNEKRRFTKEVETIREKAMRDPVHYSPLAYALSVAEGLLHKA